VIRNAQLRAYFARANIWLVLVGIVLIWWEAANLRIMPRAFLPTPMEVLKGFAEVFSNGVLQQHVKDTTVRFAIYYALASAAGVVASIAMGIVPSLGRFVRPLMGFFNAIAGIAWLPLAMIWFGAGEPTLAFVTANGVFFVVVINTLAGIQAVPRIYEHGLAVLGASKLEVVRNVLLPGAFPAVLNGLRLAMGFGWRALVASEMMAAASGLGYMVYRSSYDFRYDIVWAGILLLGFISVFIDRAVFVPLQRWTVERWGLVHEHR
jgi:NitT/TauT family transport system permease protein/taurine transport system permease protein